MSDETQVVYSYNELDEAAKEAVKDRWRESYTVDWEWWDFLLDDFVEKCRERGITICERKSGRFRQTSEEERESFFKRYGRKMDDRIPTYEPCISWDDVDPVRGLVIEWDTFDVDAFIESMNDDPDDYVSVNHANMFYKGMRKRLMHRWACEPGGSMFNMRINKARMKYLNWLLMENSIEYKVVDSPFCLNSKDTENPLMYNVAWYYDGTDPGDVIDEVELSAWLVERCTNEYVSVYHTPEEMEQEFPFLKPEFDRRVSEIKLILATMFTVIDCEIAKIVRDFEKSLSAEYAYQWSDESFEAMHDLDEKLYDEYGEEID